MPEMAEMQGLVERLGESLTGATLGGVQLLQFSALKSVTPSIDEVVGRPVTGTGRRAKYAIVELDGPRIVFHLSQGGRVDIEDPPKTTRPKPGVARLAFDGSEAHGGPVSVLIKEFGTERKAGVWLLAADDEGPMAGLGPDADTPEAAELIRTSDEKRRVHNLLRDQRFVAGLGRGHTDDVMWEARLSPYATLAKLDADQRDALVAAIDKVLADALVVERARVGGLPTKLGDRFVVHNHAGEPCPRCEADLRRVSYESYEVVYCPPCQTDGKVLADRRMSRLLK